MMRSIKAEIAPPRFHWFLAATFASAVGRNGYNVACAWLLAVSGDGVARVSMFFAILSIVELLASPVAGWLVDHFERRRLAMVADAIRIFAAPVLGCLTMFEHSALAIWMSTMVFASCDRLALTATQSMIPSVGARLSSHSANCFNYFAMQLGSLAAAALIGWILFVSTPMNCFIIIGSFFLLSVFGMWFVRPCEQALPSRKNTEVQLSTSSFSILQTGLVYATLYIGGLLVSAIGPSFVLVQLQGDALDFGHLESAWSAGSIVGAILLIPLAKLLKVHRIYVVVLIATALSFALLNSLDFPGVLVAIGLIGVAYNLGRVAAEVALQATVPLTALGRTKGILHSAAVSVGLLSLAAISTTSEATTPSSIFLVFSAIVAFVTICLGLMQFFDGRKD